MPALDEFQFNQAIEELVARFREQATVNSFNRQGLNINKNAQLGQFQRDFDVAQPRVGIGFARKGLETSGIKNVGIKRFNDSAIDQLGFINQSFNNQLDQTNQFDLNNQASFESGTGNVQAYRTAKRAEVASQISGL